MHTDEYVPLFDHKEQHPKVPPRYWYNTERRVAFERMHSTSSCICKRLEKS